MFENNINISKVPDIEMKLLCKSLLEAAERYFEVPENEQTFEIWLAERSGNQS